MATIVDIRSVSRDSASSENAPRAGRAQRIGSAEILLFTGIRYERWGEPQSGSTDLRADKRDRLQLED